MLYQTTNFGLAELRAFCRQEIKCYSNAKGSL